MNAQLGAMIALGDLRLRGRSAGDGAFRHSPSAGCEWHRRANAWTGVWSSKETTNNPLDTADGLAGRQPRWLVSGNGSDPNTSALDPNLGVTGETIELATLGVSVIDKGNINQDDTVKAPKVEILDENNVPSGHYAFWVSGGQGAREHGGPASKKCRPRGGYYRTAMAQVADPTAVSNSEGLQLLASTSSRWKDETEDPEKIGSLKNIPMFLKMICRCKFENVSREFFHDFTVHSSGVLANTKDGGLKRDLSTAL